MRLSNLKDVIKELCQESLRLHRAAFYEWRNAVEDPPKQNCTCLVRELGRGNRYNILIAEHDNGVFKSNDFWLQISPSTEYMELQNEDVRHDSY